MEYNKFSLSKKGKQTCPKCDKKTFVLYLDNETNKPLHSTVGKCDRENNCAYHYPPKQYFADNNFTFDNKPKYVPQPKPKPPPSYIETKIFEQSLRGYENNNFVQFLCNRFGKEAAIVLLKEEFAESSKKRRFCYPFVTRQNKIICNIFVIN